MMQTVQLVIAISKKRAPEDLLKPFGQGKEHCGPKPAIQEMAMV